MCNERFNERLAPLNRQHLREVQEKYPEQAEFTEKVFNILTENLTPQANLLATFVLLKDFYDRGRRGIFGAFGRVLYVPLSIVAQTGPHEWTRFRPRAVEELHSSFLSFMMAKPNRVALEQLYASEGMTLSQRHCCGIVLGDSADVAAFEASKTAANRNQMRSYAESMGMPIAVTDFDRIPRANSDLGPTERAFYDAYEDLFASMSLQDRESHLDLSMGVLWRDIVLSSETTWESNEQIAA